MTETQDLRTFWEDRYGAMTDPTNGKPSGVLERLAAGRVPGRALDIGCARGDDALWLAAKGWTVTGVDVSQTALDIAAATTPASRPASTASATSCWRARIRPRATTWR